MSSAFSGLNTVVRGLTAQQMALNTVGHNISNANTAGYSRQSVAIVASLPETVLGVNGKMQMGTGVDTQSISRARDTFMDLQMWKENTTLGYSQTQEDLMSQIEGVFSVSSTTGMQTVLDHFWSAWQTLGTNASDDSTRNLVLQRGNELASTIQQAATQLRDQVGSINTDLRLEVDAVNQITSDILALNKKISMSELAGSGAANDLRDRRDLLVDQLSEYVNIQVAEDRDSNYIIQAGSVTLVNSHKTTELTVATRKDPDYDYEVLDIQANGIDVDFANGSLKAMTEMRDNEEYGIKGYMDDLSTMSEFLLKDFNAIHRAGYGENSTENDTPADGDGNNFFGGPVAGETIAPETRDYYVDPLTSKGDWITALAVSSKLLDQTSAIPGLQLIAAKTLPNTNNVPGHTDDVQGNASGDNAVRLSQALRMNVASEDPEQRLLPTGLTPTLGATASLNSFLSGVIGTLGIQKASVSRVVDNQKTLVDQIENWRQSTSGVNMDEEMSDMIRFQKGYNATARMITTMDEMYDKLINSTGVVGR